MVAAAEGVPGELRYHVQGRVEAEGVPGELQYHVQGGSRLDIEEVSRELSYRVQSGAEARGIGGVRRIVTHPTRLACLAKAVK